jgi:hypothetical protein
MDGTFMLRAPCVANQPLSTTGNVKPCRLQIDQRDGKVEAWDRTGELIAKGVKCLASAIAPCSLQKEIRALDGKFFGLALSVLDATLKRQ